MSNTLTKAEKEFAILEKLYPCTDEHSNKHIAMDFKKEILALVDAFGNSGQSGGSAPYFARGIADTVKKLCMQECISPIMGTDDEWNEPLGFSDNSQQNNRESAIFKREDGKAYYLNAIVFREMATNVCYTGSAFSSTTGKTVYSRQYIKSFPFEPKTFYIDVREVEVSKDDWEFYIDDESQLKEVFEYYNEYEEN